MQKITKTLKKILGKKLTKKIRPLGHGLKGIAFSIVNNRPGYKLKKIGITGTKGKTTTSIYTGRLMNFNGIKTGYITTGSIYTGDHNEEIDRLNELNQIEEKILKYIEQS